LFHWRDLPLTPIHPSGRFHRLFLYLLHILPAARIAVHCKKRSWRKDSSGHWKHLMFRYLHE